jgi:perilipin-2
MRNRVVLFSVAAAVDSFLCRQLDTLETKVPVMKEPPNEVILRSKNFVADNATALKESVQSKVSSVQQCISDKATAVSQLGVVKAVVSPVKSTVDSALTMSENVVEFFLPENTDDEDEEESDEEDDSNVEDDDKDEDSSNKDGEGDEPKQGYINRVGTLSRKVRNRLYKRALRQIKHAQCRTKEALEKLKFNVDLIQYAEDHLGYPGKVLSKGARTTQATFWAVVAPESKEGESEMTSDSEAMTDPNRAVSAVQTLAKRVKGGYQAMARATEYLPSGFHNIIDSVKQGASQAMELLHAVSQLKSQPGESSSVLSRVSDLASILIAASEFVGQHVSSLLKIPVDDTGGELQSSSRFTSRASWPSLKRSKSPSLDTPQSEEEEMEEEDDADNNDDSNC